MKKFYIFSLLLIVNATSCFAFRYAFDSIPESMRLHANAVIRTNQMVYRVVNPGKAIINYKTAITLLNEKSESYRYFYIYYDGLSNVSGIKASVYDKKGKLIEVIAPSGIIDIDASTGLASDDRVKRIIFPVNKYPYTIEVEYSKEENGIIGLPAWSFQSSTDVSVEQSGVQFIIPEGIGFHYREYYLSNRVDSLYADGKKIYTWVERDIPAINNSYFITVTKSNRPLVLTSMDEFIFGGSPGSMKSWKSYGEWTYKFIEGLDNLPDEEVQHINYLTGSIFDEREKVKVLYKYMQSKTRYVNITFGVGGIKPFSARFVSEKGYGDCKALSNYMHSILNAAGIKSFYTYVNAGPHRDTKTDFVYDNTNHVILCVPMSRDTVWLECTNQTIPFNFLGDFTCNRNVLLITPEGGVLAKTPPVENNTVVNVGSVIIKRYNECTGEFSARNHGLFYDKSLTYLNKSEDEIKRSLNESLQLGTFSIPSVIFTNNNNDDPSSELSYSVTIRNFAVFSNTRIHFYPCIDKIDFLPADSLGIRIYETTTYLDTITYILPPGYDYENIPADVEVDIEAGRFSRKIIVNDNGSVVFQRSLILKEGKYSDKAALDLYGFIRIVAKTDHQKIILKLKTVS